MSDHVEEQEMEAEALSAIFDTHFTVTSDTQPFCWSVTLMPVPEEQEEEENHVIIELKATLPLDYPEISLPDLEIQVVKGLTEEHQTELLGLAQQEAQNNAGMPAIFAICEVLREWLVDHNVKGLDDVSMYSQMMRRTQEAERQEVRRTTRRVCFWFALLGCTHCSMNALRILFQSRVLLNTCARTIIFYYWNEPRFCLEESSQRGADKAGFWCDES
jgi:hypothetical protein